MHASDDREGKREEEGGERERERSGLQPISLVVRCSLSVPEQVCACTCCGDLARSLWHTLVPPATQMRLPFVTWLSDVSELLKALRIDLTLVLETQIGQLN